MNQGDKSSMQEQAYIPKNEEENYKMFSEHYLLRELLLATGKRGYPLKDKSQRTCRFCGKNSSETTFKTDAHIIPESLGRNNFISDFECDPCNFRYQTYDRALCDFFGSKRTLFNIKGKVGIPHYDSGGLAIRNYSSDFKVIKPSKPSDEIFSTNRDLGLIDINSTKPKYIPLHVFKALLKIGLCLVGDEIKNYELALKYLNDDHFSSQFKGVAQIFIQETDLGYDFPTAILFEKEKPENILPTHVFGLFCMGTFLQIILPFHKKDKFMFKPGGVEVVFSPPLIFSKPTSSFTIVNRYLGDFSGNIPISEVEKITLQYLEKPNAYYDPKTKQIHSINS